MAPPPPGLFSTTAVCLRFSCKPVAISRATTSLEPPAVNGTMVRMVLLGKPCAAAVETQPTRAMASAASSRVMHPLSCGAKDGPRRLRRVILAQHLAPEPARLPECPAGGDRGASGPWPHGK